MSRARAPFVLALACGLAAGCGGRAPGAGTPSSAADAAIGQAADAEEREGLTAARDDLDARYRAEYEAKQAELERLEEENKRMREELARREKRP